MSDTTSKTEKDDNQKKIEEYFKEFDKISSNFDKSSARSSDRGKTKVFRELSDADLKGVNDARTVHSADPKGVSGTRTARDADSKDVKAARIEQDATRAERRARTNQPGGKSVRLNHSGLPENYSESLFPEKIFGKSQSDRDTYRKGTIKGEPPTGSSYNGSTKNGFSGASADKRNREVRSTAASVAPAAGRVTLSLSPDIAAASAGGASYRVSGAGSGSGSGTIGRRSGSATSKKNKKTGKKRKIHPFRMVFFILLVFAISGAIAAFGFVTSIIKSIPEIDPNDISSFLSQNSTLYDDEGNAIDDLFFSDEGLRTNVMFNEIPKNLVDAVVAIEDKTFWTHHGFNYVRLVGAVRDSVFRNSRISGTSTITQQLARNIWLEDKKSEYSITRKIREAIYSIQLENKLTKEQIIEAYLNTIPLGNRSYGVQAAAQAYFSKNVWDLSLAECAAIASLPQAPTRYALVQTIERDKVSEDNPKLIAVGSQYAYLYNDAVESRKNMVLDFMLEQGYINESQLAEAKAVNLRDMVNPSFENEVGGSNYFADYTIKVVIGDLMSELNIDEERARQMVYAGGLKIYTTINTKTQKMLEAGFVDNANFPKLAPTKDKAGDILNSKTGAKLLYNYNNYFNEEGDFTLNPDEYELQNNGDLLLFGGKRLNFYNVKSGEEMDYNVEFKDLFVQDEDKIYYFIRGGIIYINKDYKTKTEDGDLLINKKFFDENPSAFDIQTDKIVIKPSSYTLRERVIQPQSSMVLLDYKTGAIQAMIGGRNTEGRLLYNRADSPRQPGSSIKPMSVYGPALQMGVDGEPVENGELSYGDYWTAASGIVDEPMMVGDKVWPKNWYSGYRGMQSLRRSVEQSVNVNAVKVQLNIGADRSLRFLKSLGVTTVVESGNVNDMNPAALALGGMTNGISPIQMAAGYGAFGNQGLYVKPRPYYRITNRQGDPIIDHEPESHQAMDKGVAWLITDILRSTVTNGIASRASIPSQPVAGKTGTTTDKFDAWFVGMTPRYSASLWIGCDMGVELAEGSAAATKVWSKLMTQVCDGTERGSFPSAPSNITTLSVDSYSGLLPSPYSATRTEYFISGTEPTQMDNSSSPVYICPVSGFLATPYCPSRLLFSHPAEGEEGAAKPSFYCNLHNRDVEIYPIDPERELISDFYWDGIYRDETYYDSQNQSLEETYASESGITSAPDWFLPLPETDNPYESLPTDTPFEPWIPPGSGGSEDGSDIH